MPVHTLHSHSHTPHTHPWFRYTPPHSSPNVNRGAPPGATLHRPHPSTPVHTRPHPFTPSTPIHTLHTLTHGHTRSHPPHPFTHSPMHLTATVVPRQMPRHTLPNCAVNGVGGRAGRVGRGVSWGGRCPPTPSNPPPSSPRGPSAQSQTPRPVDLDPQNGAKIKIRQRSDPAKIKIRQRSRPGKDQDPAEI